MSNRLGAATIALIYAACAALWIVVSGTLLNMSSDDPVLNNNIEILKGLAFVAVTSALLYVLVHRLGWWYLGAQLALIGMLPALNFLLNRHWTFAERPA